MSLLPDILAQLPVSRVLYLGPLAPIALAYILFLLVLGIWRVYFSPLSKFPGPKLAALTTCYQAYYDVYKFGQFFKILDQLHEKYGPIVRVNPHELHVCDPDFIDVLFTGNSQRRDKYKWIGRSILLPDSTVATISHDLHRKRRAALNPYFSKASIRRLEPIIQQTLANLLDRMSQCGKAKDIMPMSVVYKATTSDIITGYSFGKSTEYLKREDYNEPFFSAVDANFAMAWPMTYIPWLGPLLSLIPPSVMGIVYPGLKSLWDMHGQWSQQIEEIRNSKDLRTSDSTVFHGLLNSNLPPSEKEAGRMRQEAQLVVLAGQDTTAQTLSATTYELLANPEKLKKLKAELVEALPDPGMAPTATIVERLPYLTAVIQEGLRLHPGALTRMTRVAPDTAMIYKDKNSGEEVVIPAGTPVSMTAGTVQMNASIFPDPHKFEPERWLANPRLDKYMLAFSKGTRICLGFHLAYAEMYVILAGIFRKYDLYDGTGKQQGPTLALYDTIRERDVDAVIDLVVPYPAKGSHGVRLVVRA